MENVEISKKILIPTWKKYKKWTTKLRNDLLKATNEERINIFKKNPILFGEFYIKPYTRNWNLATADHHYIIIHNILFYKKNVTHVPVEHAKSTWVTIVLSIWFIINDLNTQGCIISSTARQAQGFLSLVKWHIEKNERLKRDFPYLKQGKKWTEAQIFVERNKYNQSKDPTILAIGINGEVNGARLDWVIIDDGPSINNSTTEDGRYKILKWYDEVIDSRIEHHGRSILIGTLQHDDDLLCVKSKKHYLIQNKKTTQVLEDDDFHYVHLKAHNVNENTTLWPEKWPIDRILKKIKSIGTLAYLKTLQNDRSARIGKLFNPSWLHYYKNLPEFNFKIIIGFDPSLSSKTTNPEKKATDECGIAVLFDHYESNIIYLVEEIAKHMDFNQQLKELKRIYLKYKTTYEKPVKIAVEAVYYQLALSQKLFADGFNAVGVPVHQDKVTRMELLSAEVESGRILIQENHNLFINEFINFEAQYKKSPNVMDAVNTGINCIKNRKIVDEETIDELLCIEML